jgi:hypothetical protein
MTNGSDDYAGNLSDDRESPQPEAEPKCTSKPKAQRGGYRPGGGRPAGTFKVGPGETAKVGKAKPATKLGKANAAVAEAASIIGIELDPLVALMSPVEIQLLASRMHASAAMQTSDPEDRLRKISQAASLANRIADYFDSKMPTSTHHMIDRNPETLSTAEIKALLMERAQSSVPMIEGTVDRDFDDESILGRDDASE